MVLLAAGVWSLGAGAHFGLRSRRPRYFSLWLNAPSPGSVKSGYELRFTETTPNTYSVTLSRWQAGVKTELAANPSFALPLGSQFALVEKAGTLSAWTKTPTTYTQLFSAPNGTFKAGFAGIEGSGNITRLTSFQAGPLAPF